MMTKARTGVVIKKTSDPRPRKSTNQIQPAKPVPPLSVEGVTSKGSAIQAVEDSAGHALALVDANCVGRALESSGWTPEAAVATLVSIASAEELAPRARIAAIEALDKMNTQALRLSGRLATMVANIDEDTEGGRSRNLRAELTVVNGMQAPSSAALLARFGGVSPEIVTVTEHGTLELDISKE